MATGMQQRDVSSSSFHSPTSPPAETTRCATGWKDGIERYRSIKTAADLCFRVWACVDNDWLVPPFVKSDGSKISTVLFELFLDFAISTNMSMVYVQIMYYQKKRKRKMKIWRSPQRSIDPKQLAFTFFQRLDNNVPWRRPWQISGEELKFESRDGFSPNWRRL